MELTLWLDKWQKNDIGFHASEVEPLLVKYFSDITPGVVFVPLCGKSLDLLWLAHKGWQVVGVEASPLACRAFFEENKIEFTERAEGSFTFFQSERIRLWCGDFFKLTPEHLICVSAVYDRAALIALPPEVRVMYVAHLSKIIGSAPSIRMLLITLEYLQEKVSGPPFSVEASEVQRLYGNDFVIHETEREEDLYVPANNPRFKGVRVFECVFQIQR